jgi:hypothetical protein
MSVSGLRSNDPRLEHSRISFVAAALLGEYTSGVGSLTCVVLLNHVVHALCHTALGSGVCFCETQMFHLQSQNNFFVVGLV